MRISIKNILGMTMISAMPMLAHAQSNPEGWFLKARQVQAGKPFTLQMLNQKYGNCQTAFSSTEAVMEKGVLNAKFKTVTDSNKVCITDIRPWGPSFEMAGLEAGRYPVVYWEVPACYPDCHLIPGFKSLDTLTVGTSTALTPLAGPSLSSATRGSRKTDLRSISGRLEPAIGGSPSSFRLFGLPKPN
jgi:hypothetical protein